MRCVAVDPGPHTGLASIDDEGNYDTTMFHNELGNVIDWIVIKEPEEIVIERFVPFAQGPYQNRMDRNRLDTVEIQGAILGLAHMLNVRVRWHTTQVRMPFIAPARQILKVGKAKIDSHEVDALAHLLAWQEIKYPD